jgi:hypothetical protein
MNNVLAIDGSKFSDAAVHTVTQQARAQDTEILVFHVVEPSNRVTPNPRSSMGLQSGAPT